MSYPYIFSNYLNVRYALYFIGRHGADCNESVVIEDVV